MVTLVAVLVVQSRRNCEVIHGGTIYNTSVTGRLEHGMVRGKTVALSAMPVTCGLQHGGAGFEIKHSITLAELFVTYG